MPPPTSPVSSAETPPPLHPASSESASPPVAPVASAQPAAAPSTAATAPTPERVGEFWRRFHLVLGGGISPFGTRTYLNAPTYEAAAPRYGTPGGMFFAQPSASVVITENFDFRIGVGLEYHHLGRTQTAGAPDSSIGLLALSPLLLEADWTPHPFFGLGANLSVGYAGAMSSNADVGAPVSATLDFGDQGGVFLGLQAYVSTWNQAIRLGYSLSMMPSGYTLPTVPTDPRASATFEPIHTFILGVDPVRLFGNFAGARWF